MMQGAGGAGGAGAGGAPMPIAGMQNVNTQGPMPDIATLREKYS